MTSHSQRSRDERLVVGIAGRIGAGKTSVGRYLSSTHGFQYIRYSQVLSDWRAKDPESKAHLQEVGWRVMAGGMQSELNRHLLARIVPSSNAAVDGLRHPVDYESLKDSFLSSFHLLYIDSSLNDRWGRLKNHSKYTSLGSLEAADSHPVEQQIESLRANADLVIGNDGSLEDLHVAVDEAILRFRKAEHK